VERACWKALADRPLAVLRATGDGALEAILEREPRLRLRLLYRFAEGLEAAQVREGDAPSG